MHDIYGVSPMYSLRNISSNPSFSFACTNIRRVFIKFYQFSLIIGPIIMIKLQSVVPVWDTLHQMHG
jgi:hypothetical protein